MSSYNRVILMGNLTRDPELRYLPSGTAVANFGLAVNRVYNDKQSNEKKTDVCFVDITVWTRQAEICNEYLRKGSPLLLEGRLNFSSWETEDGQKRNKLDVVAERIQLIGNRQDNSQSQGSSESQDAPPTTDDITF